MLCFGFQKHSRRKLYKSGGIADTGDANGIESAVKKHYVVAPEAYTLNAEEQLKIYMVMS